MDAMTEHDENRGTNPGEVETYPRFRSHYLPRSRQGWIAVLLFLGLFAFTQPPLVYVVANRIEPTIFGLPFLYSYLLVIYLALISVLIWAQRRKI
jgi:hypothetical protein